MYNPERLTAPRYLTSNVRKLLIQAGGIVVPASSDFDKRMATETLRLKDPLWLKEPRVKNKMVSTDVWVCKVG